MGAYPFEVVSVNGDQAPGSGAGKIGAGRASTLGTRAVISIDEKALVPVWGSLTLLGTYGGFACRVCMIKASPFLIALTGVQGGLSDMLLKKALALDKMM